MRNFDWRRLFRLEGGAVWLILCGLLLTVKPDLASAAVSAVLGWVLIACGVMALIAGFVGRLGFGTIVSGGLLVAAGSWLHRHPVMIATVIGLVLGGLLLSQSFEAAVDSMRMKRQGLWWISGAVMAVLMGILGVRMLLSPLGISRLAMRLAGLTMVVCGISNLIGHDRARGEYRGSSPIIDADE